MPNCVDCTMYCAYVVTTTVSYICGISEILFPPRVIFLLCLHVSQSCDNV